jgi:formate-dependent nitrite reductase membrane component NrfD
LPVLAGALLWKYPVLLNESYPFRWIATGLAAGIGSHLFWDCVGSRDHKIIVVPYWFSFKSAFSRLWLLAGAAICLGAAACYGDAKLASPFKLDVFQKVRPNSGVLLDSSRNSTEKP